MRRERPHGGIVSVTARLPSLMTDKHVRVAYDDILWTKDSAEEYVTALKQYSDPLTMIDEPRMETTEFLETTLHNPTGDGQAVTTVHKLRPWEERSYRICRLGVAGRLSAMTSVAGQPATNAEWFSPVNVPGDWVPFVSIAILNSTNAPGADYTIPPRHRCRKSKSLKIRSSSITSRGP
eukprot:SAG11_NODE_553_length_8575_cov_18.074328_7_plen_179_part_00